MGAVYRAEDMKLERVVAIKVIRPEMANDREMMQRFKQELILAREVTHRNVVRLYDLVEADGVDFITMEFVEGEDLKSLLDRRGKLPAAEAADIISQMSAGLGAAHATGIVHRDLKPGNIMVDRSGRVVVMDFGLARSFDGAGAGMTRSGALVGTFEYMSPEQAKCEPLDARSDLYTVGLIFYELLTGVRPFQAESAVASLILRSQQRAKPPSSYEASVPKQVSDICERCLEIAPEKRYQSSVQLIAAIDEWRSPSARGTQTRTRWQIIAAAAIGVCLVAIAGSLWMFHNRNAKPAGPHAPVSVLVADFHNNTGDSVFDGTLEPMFNVALEGASFINAYDRGQALKLAAKLPKPASKLDEEPARLVAVSQGISTVITGDLSKEGEGYRIRAEALDPLTGKVIATADAEAPNKDGVLSALPKIAVPLRKALGDNTPESVQFDEVAGGFTAASLDAVHENAVGVEQQFAGKFQEAFDSFQRAAQLDPKFARAYTGMAAMAQNLGRPQDAEKYMKMAMEHVDRMTERERYRNRGLYFLSTGDWQKCVEEYNQLITRYPADRVGQNNLATCYTQLRNAPKAVEAAKHAVEIVPKGVGQRLNLSFIETFAGDFAGGEHDARAALEMNPNALQGFLVLAEAELGEGQLSAASENYEKLAKANALGASIASGGEADLAAYEGKLSDAGRILEQGATADLASKSADSAARKYGELANVQVLLGNTSAATAAAAKALANSQSVQVRFLAGRAYAQAGDLGNAQKLAGTLSAELAAEPQAYGKIISGMIALKKGDANTAIKQISDGNNILDTWIGRFELGRAYLAAGAFTEADSEFERCMRRRGEAIELFMDNFPTFAYFPAVYYYQGRTREGMKSDGYADLYKNYLAIRGRSSEDKLSADAKKRLGQ